MSPFGECITSEPDVASAREAVVRQHMESENRYDFDGAMATCSAALPPFWSGI